MGSIFDWCCTLSARYCARANITAASSAHCPYLPACKRSLSLLLPFHLPNSRSQNPLFLFDLLTFYHSDIPSSLHFVHIPFSPALSEIKAFFLFPAAHLATRQIAPLVSKWPKQKDNDKRAVSQLSFPLSAPASHITVIDCSVSGSAIVPQDTREPCQK